MVPPHKHCAKSCTRQVLQFPYLVVLPTAGKQVIDRHATARQVRQTACSAAARNFKACVQYSIALGWQASWRHNLKPANAAALTWGRALRPSPSRASGSSAVQDNLVQL
jgi:hypothetical protein